MKPGGSMPHSQELFNNPYPEPKQPSFKALCDDSKPIFVQCEVVSLTPNPQAGESSLIDVHDCLLNIFAVNLHIWKPTPILNLKGRAMSSGSIQ